MPLCAAWLCTTMVAGGALYARHPERRPATAIRIASAGGYRPVPGRMGSGLGPAGASSVYDLVSELRDRAVSSDAPATAVVAGRRAGAPPAPVRAATPAATPASSPVASAPADAGTAATTTTPPLVPVLEKVLPAAASAGLGVASWFDAPAGTCAHRDLPLGTVVKVTRTSTGASTTCRVADRGPSPATNRVIDLSQDTFQKLASPDAGVIDVRIEW